MSRTNDGEPYPCGVFTAMLPTESTTQRVASRKGNHRKPASSPRDTYKSGKRAIAPCCVHVPCIDRQPQQTR